MGRLHKLISSDFEACPEFLEIKNSVDRFTELLLSEYIENQEEYIQNSDFISPNNTKSFFDSVWGSIELNQGEVLLVDSPVIQRLRSIKQLGLVDYLYSSANHTRFSHTLGVVYTSELMANHIFRLGTGFPEKNSRSVIQLIRLAAIFHDSGHFFGSHASEYFFQEETFLYSKVRMVEKCRNYFYKYLKIRPSISEIISILILNSVSVRNLLKLISDGFDSVDFKKKDDELIEQISCLILGYPYNKDWIPFSQIINGQIDADKIDYLKRDAYSTGLPTAVDFSRIIQKIRLVSSKKLLEMISNEMGVDHTHFEFAIAPSAVNTIDQFIISRLMMFENVYLHPKTFSSEIYFRYALELLDKSTEGLLDDFYFTLQIVDSDLVNQDIQFHNSRFNKFVVKNQDSFMLAKRIFNRIYNRQLLKRCVAINNGYIDYVEGSNGQQEFTNLFGNRLIEKQRELLVKVETKLRDILQTLGKAVSTDLLIMQYPDISTIHIDSNVQIAVSDKKNKNRNQIFETDKWINSRESKNDIIYILGNGQIRHEIYIATELILYEDYGIIIKDGDLYDDNDETRINEIREKLVAGGFYNNAVGLIHVESLENKTGKFTELINNWGTYEYITTTRNRTRLEPKHLFEYVQQFYQFEQELHQFPLFIDGICKMFDSVHFLSKRDIEDSLYENLSTILCRENAKTDDLVISALGSYQDSAAIIANSVNIINERLNANWEVRKPETLTKDECKKIIVFVDDAFYSGSQLISIFQELKGIPLDDRIIKEHHVSSFSKEFQSGLNTSKFYLSFIYQNSKRINIIKEKILELDFPLQDIIATHCFPDPYFEKKGGNSTENDITELVKNYFIKASQKIMYYKSHDESGNWKKNWNEERVFNSLLGYENAQQLIVYPWNTPTFTITPLWLPCNKDVFSWKPLFQRIDKTSNLK